jgi:hypothetical protein
MPSLVPTPGEYVPPPMFQQVAGGALYGMAQPVFQAAYAKGKEAIFGKDKNQNNGSGRGRRSGVIVKVDGVSSGRKRVSRKSKRPAKKKKSLKKQVSEVRKLLPKVSRKTFRDFDMVEMATTGVNQRIIFDIDAFEKTYLSTYAANLTKVDDATTADYTQENTKIRMSLFYKLHCKNNMTANVDVSYCFFNCKDDDAEAVVDSMREEMLDRGYTGIATTDNRIPRSATAAIQPRQLVLTNSEYWAPTFGGGAVTRKWAQVGKVKKVTLGPGDTIDMVYSKKNFTYNQEYLDQENIKHLKGYSVRLVVVANGQLAHDAADDNKSVIGRGFFKLDCEQQRQATVVYSNPKGLNEVAYTDGYQLTNFTTPVHADNMQSAIEQGQE